MKRNAVLLVCLLLCAGFARLSAQTTLSGDHVISGSLDVGTTASKGALTVSGQTGSTAIPGINVTGDGGVLFAGTLGTGSIPTTGTGTRFMWYPGKAALRVGVPKDADSWSDLNIGIGSFATSESLANGPYAVALSGGVAQGTYAAAMSNGLASNYMSTAMSAGEAYAHFSTAMSGGQSYATGSTTMSEGTTLAAYATAMSGAYASGDFSTALSYSNTYGLRSTAMSGGSAGGDFSTAAGYGAMANSYGSFVIGRNNDVSGSTSSTEWVPSDYLFAIGNGTGVATDPVNERNRNAMTVYKNGKVQITGEVQMTKRQGDILMGEFGNPE